MMGQDLTGRWLCNWLLIPGQICKKNRQGVGDGGNKTGSWSGVAVDFGWPLRPF